MRSQNSSSGVDYTALPKKTQTRLERIHSSVTGVVPEEKKSWKFNTKDLVVGIDVNFECARYPEGTAHDVIQAIEDTLWSDLLPMFGRQGAR